MQPHRRDLDTAPEPLPSARRIFWLTPDRFDDKPDKSSWLEMARLMNADGWRVRILAAGSRGRSGGAYPDAVHYFAPRDLPFIFRIHTLITAGRWLKRNLRTGDVVILNPDALWLMPMLKKHSGVHVHLDIRTLPVNTDRLKGLLDRALFWTLPMRRFGKTVDSHSLITERLKIEVANRFGIDCVESPVWQSGVNTDLFRPAPQSEPAPADRLRLFYHGSLSKQRGVDILLEALALEPFPFRCELTIVGDGPDRAELEALSRSLGLHGQVRFTGLVPYEAVVTEIGRADIGVCPLPDRLEWNVSSPLKVLEYMACAKPMILTPIAAHRDVVRDQPFVIWTGGFTAADFHRAIRSAWERREALSQTRHLGRELVLERYTWQHHANVLSRFLRSRPELRKQRQSSRDG